MHDLRLVNAGDTLRLEVVGALARQTGQSGIDLADGRLPAALATPTSLASGGYSLIARSADDIRGII